MKAKPIWVFLAVLALSLTESSSCNSPATIGRTTITASVAASLQRAMEEIVAVYERTHANVRVTLNFGSSGMLAQQIEHGAPADVFFSAAPKPMDELDFKGLLQPGTRRDLLRNRIVLIAPKGQSNLWDFAALSSARVKLIALGDPGSVPAGDYGKQVLMALGLWEKLQSKLVLAKDVRQVLSYVETGNADAGIVYATDAKDSTQVRVAAIAPDSTHTRVVYPVAVVKQRTSPLEAKRFVEFLAGAQAREVFVRHGFTPVEP